jgi:hypothetical protein
MFFRSRGKRAGIPGELRSPVPLLWKRYTPFRKKFCHTPCTGDKAHRRQLNGFMALDGQSQTWFFSSFFAAKPRKKKKKGYFWGIASPKPPLCKAASR